MHITSTPSQVATITKFDKILYCNTPPQVTKILYMPNLIKIA